jgi:alanine-alpha-ketoisovalerate/valine-pyruvate aminotransferase
VYLVTDEVGMTATLIRAGSQAQAIKHVVEPVYKAKVATIEDVVKYMMANPGAKIEDAGEEAE